MDVRNGAVDFMKFVFSVIIVLFHTYRILPRGYLGVEFFFVVSGYFMSAHYYNNKEKYSIDNLGKSTLLFVKNKISKILPNYYIAWIIAFIVTHVYKKSFGIRVLLYDFFRAIPELLLLGMTGFWDYTHSYNVVVWYISAMLLVSA